MDQGSRPLSNFLVTVSFAEAFGHDASISDLEKLLRQYNRRDVVAAFAKLNAVLQTWRILSVDNQIDERVAKEVFTPSVIRSVQRTSDNFKRLFFPRLSILATIKMALRICSSEGRPIESAEDVGMLFAGCMILNGQTPQSPRGNSTADMISQLLPLYDFTPRTSYEADICRSLYMFERITPDLIAKNPKSEDFSSLFADAVGVEPRTFAEFCFALAAQYLRLDGD